MDLEERSIESLPERCENCGTALTDAEKAAALDLAADAPVLCTTCSVELVPDEEVPEA
jgi:hypothetical protein